MPKHSCIDPRDPFAQREVLVDFEYAESGFRFIAAIDADGDDILADLIDIQRCDLERELGEAARDISGFLRPSSPDQARVQPVPLYVHGL
jgi:hypothetical protein